MASEVLRAETQPEKATGARELLSYLFNDSEDDLL